MTDQPAGESRDGSGSGDHDLPFKFGVSPEFCMSIRDVARLMILRGKIRDFQHGSPGGPGDGDLGYLIERPSGLVVPLTEPNPFPQE